VVNNIDLYSPSLKDIYTQARADMIKQSQGEADSNASFMDFLQGALDRVNSNFIQADDAMKGFMLGKGELHEVLMSIQKANLEFRFAMQVRNKLIETYQEIMRMQV
jgi:flagellar hook-basal body complex protein FliE